MGEELTPRSTLSRRGFLKASGAVGALAAAGGMAATTGWLASAAAADNGEEIIRYARHCVNCGNRCHLKCTVRDGRLVKVEPSHPDNYVFSRCCHRGMSEVERVYSPARIQTPLKRVGERGEGKFEAISWDEAYDEVIAAFKAHQPNEIIIYGSTGSTIEYNYQLLPKFLGCAAYQSHAKNGIDMAISNTLTVSGTQSGYSGIRSWTESDVVVNVGQNLLETSLQDTRFWMQALKAGTKIITFETRYTVTAQKSSQWIPIQMGSDAAFWLMMQHEIIARKLYDEAYCLSMTTLPHLVNTATGKKATGDDFKAAPVEGEAVTTETAEEATPAVAMVWDKATDAPVAFDAAGAEPELFKTVEVNGVTYKTVMTMLEESCKEYTVAWAVEKTQIPEDVIEGFIADFTKGKTFLTYGMGSIDKYTNSDIFGHAVSNVMAMTNNLAGKGKGLQNCNNHRGDWGATWGSWATPAEFKAGKLALNAAAYPFDTNYKGIANPIKVFFGAGNVFQQMWSNSPHIYEWLKTIDFICVVDLYHCTSVDWADIVLPAAGGFESEHEIRWYGNARSHAWLSQKVLDPLFDSKTDWQIEHDILTKMGYGQYIPKDRDEHLAAVFNTTNAALQGITIQSLLDNECLQHLNVPTTPNYSTALEKGFSGTNTKKVEIYHECQLKHGQALPKYVPLYEVENDEVKAKFPFQLTQHHSRFKAHSTFGNAAWIRQFYGPAFDINPADAEQYGIKNGDTVEVYNDRGSVKAAARVTEMIHPGELAISTGWWDTQMVEGTVGNVGNDTLTDRHWDLPIGPMIPFMDTQVAIRKA